MARWVARKLESRQWWSFQPTKCIRPTACQTRNMYLNLILMCWKPSSLSPHPTPAPNHLSHHSSPILLNCIIIFPRNSRQKLWSNFWYLSFPPSLTHHLIPKNSYSLCLQNISKMWPFLTNSTMNISVHHISPGWMQELSDSFLPPGSSSFYSKFSWWREPVKTD